MSNLTYDQSLPCFCSILEQAGRMDLLDRGWFVRNPRGALCLIVPDDVLAQLDVHQLRGQVAAGMPGGYAQQIDELVVRASAHQLGEAQHLALPEMVLLESGQSVKARVIDRRALGQDWLRYPLMNGANDGAPPRLVFWSLKGGVGRTTALTVLAASLAAEGQNVLVVDLDLEAPGVGDQLLQQEDIPRFGVLDCLVEMRANESDAGDLLLDAVGVSSLTKGQGLVHVFPAAGQQTRENPSGYLGKLFRAYGEHAIDGATTTFADRVDRLIKGLTEKTRYDAVLIDARAGISESTAASILNLGGDVLLFGHYTPQTFSGYSYAFAHLSRFILAGKDEWVMRLKMVHAKAPLLGEAQESFRDDAFELYSTSLYGGSEDSSFSLDDMEAPHYAWVILDDGNYRDFDPRANPQLLTGTAVQATFGDFVRHCKERLGVRANGNNQG